jgi:hypothetical protein
VSLPVVGSGGPLGMLHLGVDVRFVDGLMMEMLYDVLVVLVVSLFFTLELLHFMAGARLEQALGALGDVFSRGAAGDFGAPRRRRSELAFGGAIQALEQTLARVHNHWVALLRDLRRRPANHWRCSRRAWRRRRRACRRWPRATASARRRLRSALPMQNWARCERRCSSSSWPRS